MTKASLSTLFIGNLSFSTSADSLRCAFAAFEGVDVHLVVDLETKKSRGFAFITVSSADSAAVISAMNGARVDGRAIKVDDISAPGVAQILSFLPDAEKPAALRAPASAAAPTSAAPKRVNWEELEQSITSDPQGIVIHEGGAIIEGDLNLDDGVTHFVRGDLEVKGNIVARDDEAGMVIVAGNCRAKNFISGGLGGFIKGDLVVGNAVVTDYNHGKLVVDGSISARLVAAEHELVVRGAIQAQTIDFGGFRVEDPAFKPNVSYAQATREVARTFVPEVLDKQGRLNGRLLIDRLLAEKPVLLSPQ